MNPCAIMVIASAVVTTDEMSPKFPLLYLIHCCAIIVGAMIVSIIVEPIMAVERALGAPSSS